jgi:hypothetical protein
MLRRVCVSHAPPAAIARGPGIFSYVKYEAKRVTTSKRSHQLVGLRVILLCVMAQLFGIAKAQVTIHVPADQPTIQAGINAANNGDTVECPASFVPVELIQTGIKGAFYGTREEA